MGEGDAAERIRVSYGALLRAEADAQGATWLDVDRAIAAASVTAFIDDGSAWVRIDGIFGRTTEFELGSEAETDAFLAWLARDQIGDLIDDFRDGPGRD